MTHERSTSFSASDSVHISDYAIVRILSPAYEHDIALPISVRKARVRNWPSVRRSEASFDWARWHAATLTCYTAGTISPLGGLRGLLMGAGADLVVQRYRVVR